MAIVIKEIILSDNLEKFMEKVNFNFDQLLLAGGGPPGPQGIQGLIGPAGPQGGRGNYWDVGSTASESIMEIAIGGSLINGDLFLADGTDPFDPYGIKGQIYSWNDTMTQFDDTGLNLIGPPGPTGSAGANLGWNVYAGVTNPNEIIWPLTNGVVGLTANFHFLKGDTVDPYVPGAVEAGITAGRSRDTLWLGGYEPATTMQGDPFFANLEFLPKLFVSPRIPLDSSSSAVTLAGIVGSGITIGIEDDGTDGYPNKNSFSNIVVDTDLNLRITNFSNFINATTPRLSIISIESQRATQILAGGWFKGSGDPLGDSLQSIQIGAGLTGQENPIQGAALNGIVIKTSDTNTADQVVQIELKQQDIFRVFKDTTQTGYPAMLLDGHSGVGIVIAPENVTDIVATGASYGRLFAYNNNNYGPHGSGTIDIIALGSWSYDNTSNQVTLSAIDQKIHIGYGSAINDANNSLYNLPKHSLNVMGNIRMAGGTSGGVDVTTAGNIIKSADEYGKMEWSNLNIDDIVTGDGIANRLAYWNVTDESISDTVTTDHELQWDPANDGSIGLQYDTLAAGTGKFLQSLDSNGSADWADVPPGVQVDIYRADGQWTAPAGAKVVEVHCVGGGGGGGGGHYYGLTRVNPSLNNELYVGGQGGQGGGYTVQKYIADNTSSSIPSGVVEITVGAGGAGGTGSGGSVTTVDPLLGYYGGDGIKGGDSSFGHVIAYGGAGAVSTQKVQPGSGPLVLAGPRIMQNNNYSNADDDDQTLSLFSGAPCLNGFGQTYPRYQTAGIGGSFLQPSNGVGFNGTIIPGDLVSGFSWPTSSLQTSGGGTYIGGRSGGGYGHFHIYNSIGGGFTPVIAYTTKSRGYGTSGRDLALESNQSLWKPHGSDTMMAPTGGGGGGSKSLAVEGFGQAYRFTAGNGGSIVGATSQIGGRRCENAQMIAGDEALSSKLVGNPGVNGFYDAGIGRVICGTGGGGSSYLDLNTFQTGTGSKLEFKYDGGDGGDWGGGGGGGGSATGAVRENNTAPFIRAFGGGGGDGGDGGVVVITYF